MGFVWNLGNTLDSICGSNQNQGLSTEICWGASKTTEEMIDRWFILKRYKDYKNPSYMA